MTESHQSFNRVNQDNNENKTDCGRCPEGVIKRFRTGFGHYRFYTGQTKAIDTSDNVKFSDYRTKLSGHSTSFFTASFLL